MGATLLVQTPSFSWREWLKNHRTDRDILCLDPTDATFGQPCRFSLIRRERPVWERFYGSLDPGRAPHVLIASFVEGISLATENSLVLLPPFRNSPVMRQTLQLIFDLAKSSEILVPEGVVLPRFRSQHVFESVNLEKSLPNAVQTAQRKAQWISLKERCEDHIVDLRSTIIEGVRLGSGEIVDEHQKTKLQLDGAYVEVVGSSLFVVTDQEFDDGIVTRAMDYTHTQRVHFVNPKMFQGVLCAFTKQSGEDFGFGEVDEIDFINLRARVKCTAIPPVPVKSLRLGSLRIDEKGNEIGELKPWQI